MRATSIALGSMSVAKMQTSRACLALSMCSARSMASEYASSPVEQPGTQTRICPLTEPSSKSRGTTFSWMEWNAS